MKSIVYRDGVQVVAVGPSYDAVRYGIARPGDETAQQVVLNQEQARELAAALAWIIGEVDATHGYESFTPRPTPRRARRAVVQQENR